MSRAALKKLNFVASHTSTLCSLLNSKIQLLAIVESRLINASKVQECDATMML